MAKKYVVTARYLGLLNKGDIVDEAALPSDRDALVKEKSIREATADEIEEGYLLYTDEKGNPTTTKKRMAFEKKAAEAAASPPAPPAETEGGGK